MCARGKQWEGLPKMRLVTSTQTCAQRQTQLLATHQHQVGGEVCQGRQHLAGHPCAALVLRRTGGSLSAGESVRRCQAGSSLHCLAARVLTSCPASGRFIPVPSITEAGQACTHTIQVLQSTATPGSGAQAQALTFANCALLARRSSRAVTARRSAGDMCRRAVGRAPAAVEGVGAAKGGAVGE